MAPAEEGRAGFDAPKGIDLEESPVVWSLQFERAVRCARLRSGDVPGFGNGTGIKFGDFRYSLPSFGPPARTERRSSLTWRYIPAHLLVVLHRVSQHFSSFFEPFQLFTSLGQNCCTLQARQSFLCAFNIMSIQFSCDLAFPLSFAFAPPSSTGCIAPFTWKRSIVHMITDTFDRTIPITMIE